MHRFRTPAIALLTTLVAALIVPISAPASAADGPPLLLYGTVVDSTGQPIADATVVVRAQVRQDGSDDVVVGTTIATGKSAASGEFLLQTPYEPVTGLDDDGAMPLEIEVFSGELEKLFNVDAVPPASEGGSWTWGDVVDDSLLPQQSRSATLSRTPLSGVQLSMANADQSAANVSARTSYDALATPAAEAELAAARSAAAPTGAVAMALQQDPDGSGLERFDDPGPADGAGSVDTEPVETKVTRHCPYTEYICYITGDPGPCSSGADSVWRWMKKNAYLKRWLPTQKLTARSKSKMKYEWETSDQTEMQVAYAGYGSHYAGGLTKSWNEVNAAGIIANVGPDWNGELDLQWRFRKQRQWCLIRTPYGGVYRDSGKRRWMPLVWTGGNRNRVDSWTWQCNQDNTTYTDNQLWVARASSVRWVQWFEIAGVQLDSVQTNSSAHRLTVIPRSGQRVHICGSNDIPTRASSVREITP
jgi:hypothetical protein